MKRHTTKQIITFFLIVCLCITMLPFKADASSNEQQIALPAEVIDSTLYITDSGTCGENLTWAYYAENQSLVIKGTGAMYDYTCQIGYCSSPWSGYVRNITSVSLPEGLTYIGNWAFYCIAATSVTIPSSVQSISGTAFMEAKITDYYVASGNASLDAVNGVLYSKDHTLLISYPSGRTETSYDILPGTKRIGEYAFLYNFDLKTVTIPESVVEIGQEAFSDTGITEISIPEGVTVIEYDVFHQCGYLEKVKLPNTLKQIKSGAFLNCRSLSEINIPNGVETIGWVAFWGCTGLETIVLPASLTSIDDSAFQDCANLRTVYFWGNAPEIGDDVFKMKDSSENMVNIPDLVLYYIEGKTGWTSPTWNGYPTVTWKPAHEHTYTETVTAPTCTEQGYTTHICTVCGDSYVDTYVVALGHKYENGVCVQCGEKDPNEQPTIEFVDVPQKAWYVDAVNYAVQNGLMNGVGNDQFNPEGSMTRAMLVTVLWRHEGQPEAGENTFSDVQNGKWYTKAVAWAAENGIVGGVGNNRFDPDGEITREQMATILYRYAANKGIDTGKRGDLSAFPDANKISAYAKEAIAWAVGEGIINGSDGKLLPQGNATRAQVATILMRFIENIVKK